VTDKSFRRKPGEGGVSRYETASGEERWMISYRIPDTKTGRSRQRNERGFTSVAEATRTVRRRVTAVEDGKHVEPSKDTLGNYLDQWLAALPSVSDATRSSYEKNLRLHVKPYLGDVPLGKVSRQKIARLYADLEDHGRADGTGGLSARTTRYVHTILRHALADAVEDGRIGMNPTIGKSVPVPSAARAAAPEMKVWTPAQLQTFLTWCKATSTDGRHQSRHELAVAWRLLAMSGMRRGEALALRWGDIDFETGRVSVRRSVGVVHIKGQAERLVEKRPKTAAGTRVVKLDAGTLAELRARRSDVAEVALLLARDDAHAEWHQPQGRTGAPRSREHLRHDEHLLPRHPGHAGRGCS